jgi:hypothetical protein
MKTSSTNNITREVGITGALKFENCDINVTAGKKINEFMSDFLCDPLESKIVYIIQSRRSFCASPNLLISISRLTTKKTHFYSL